MSVREGADSGFVDRLEALRGIAALWVAVGHSLIWLSIGPTSLPWAGADYEMYGWQVSISHIILTLFNGNAAVDVFFVLSGFVLAKSLSRTAISSGSYWGYALRRIFRIVPAFWLSLFIVAIYLTFLYPGHAVFPGASSWFTQWYEAPLNSSTLIDNATFVSPWLNPNAWTLKVEIVVSLLLPVIIWCLGSSGVIRSAMIFAGFFVVGWIARDLNLNAMHYAYMFVAGAIVAKHDGFFRNFDLKFWNCLVVASAALIVFSNLRLRPHSMAGDVVVAIASVGLIWAAESAFKVKYLAILDARWARFLGRVSYSFYLLHFIVLYAVANLSLHFIPAWFVIRWPLPVMIFGSCVAMIVAIPLSVASFHFVEKPFTLFGRKLSTAMNDAISETPKTQ